MCRGRSKLSVLYALDEPIHYCALTQAFPERSLYSYERKDNIGPPETNRSFGCKHWCLRQYKGHIGMARFEIMTGPERRRSLSEEQKRTIVAAAFASGAIVADVARRAAICCPGMPHDRIELVRFAILLRAFS